jgi:PPOX class probable F420-dependent enzyme
MKIPETHKDLFEDEIKAFAFLSTTMDSGTPQVTPVWFDMEGDLIRINSARGRVKDRNMVARPHVALAIMDPADPYRYIQVRGKVVKITEEGGRAHINRLSKKYRGVDVYPGDPKEVRVTYLIQPTSCSTMG